MPLWTFSPRTDDPELNKADEWFAYLQYLRQWIEENKDFESYGNSPLLFVEFVTLRFV